LDASRAPLELLWVERILRSTRSIRLYNTLTFSRFWFAEIWPLRQRFWKHAWETARHAAATNGEHLLAVIRRHSNAGTT